MGPTADVVRALMLAVRTDTDDADLLDAVGDGAPMALERLAALAQVHRVGALVSARYASIERFAERCPGWLSGERGRARALHLHSMRAARVANTVLDGRVLVFKGPALARWYGTAEARVFSDLDLLVRRENFGLTVDNLVSAGFQQESDNWAGFLKHGAAEIPLSYGGTWVDLHWDPIALKVFRRHVRLDVDELFRRATPVAATSGPLSTFGPTDTLLHLCVATGLDGGRRLLSLADIDRVARSGAVSWSDFAECARRSGAAALCTSALDRCRRVLGTPVPADVGRELAPFPGWRAVNRAIGERRHSAKRVEAGIGSGAVMAAGRDRVAWTAGALCGAVRAELRARLGGIGLTEPGGELDWQLSQSHGAGDRDRYLGWVEGPQ